MKHAYWSIAREVRDHLRLPAVLLAEWRHDREGLRAEAADPERVLAELIAWLGRAQDNSSSHDGGVARDYSLIHGWASSYPETTGYAIPTLLEYAGRRDVPDAAQRARRMLNWLVSIQLPCGGFQGGKIDARTVVPVTFNTGQILLGLAAGESHFGNYRDAMRAAADWLVQTQDKDGCWRRYPTPFARHGEKAYETHVAWGLLEAARIDNERRYAESALANVRWALSQQMDNGWIRNCCLDDPARPLTHTLGYALRGVLEAYRFSGETPFLQAARRTADGIMSALSDDGQLPGRLSPDWRGAVRWVCLTGNAQLAYCWLMLFDFTQEVRYALAAFRANEFVRRTVRIEGAPEVRGAVKGSHPIGGAYGRYQYLNWAAKFLADSLMLEMDVRRRTGL